MTDVREALRELVDSMRPFHRIWLDSDALTATAIGEETSRFKAALDNARAALSTPEGVDALDARRYRWLKTRPAIPWVKLMPSDVYVDGEFDSAIDAAMQKDQESR